MRNDNAIKLLKELLDYALKKPKSRGGWYCQALEDAIQTLEEGNFEKVRQRDLDYERGQNLRKIRSQKPKKKK